MWEERGRPEDLLWTGTSFGEYQLWRERYEGGLSTAEESFGDAMVHKAERQKRRRRDSRAGAFAILLAVLGVIGWFGWQAELERRGPKRDPPRRGRQASRPGRGGDRHLPHGHPGMGHQEPRASGHPRRSDVGPTGVQKSPPATVLKEPEIGAAVWRLAFSGTGQWLGVSGEHKCGVGAMMGVHP